MSTLPDGTPDPGADGPTPADDALRAGLRLKPGVWIWLWDHDSGWSRLDAHKLAAELVAVGAVGVLPHGAQGMMRWCRGGATAAFRAAGLDVLPSLSWVRTETIVGALDVPDGLGAMLDWEGWWESKQAMANSIVDDVLRQRPDAAERAMDCPWWAPLSYIDRAGHPHATHPRAPTREFGRLCQGHRAVQAYGAPHDGRSTAMLANARRPSQYPALGTPAALVVAGHQLYARSVTDVVRTTLAEPVVVLWDWLGHDPAGVVGLRIAAAMRAAGCDGPGAIERFQHAHGLRADGLVGPLTAAAARVPWTPGLPITIA